MRLQDEYTDDPILIEKLRAQQAYDEARARAVRNCEKQKYKYVNGMPSEKEVNITEVIFSHNELNLAEIPRYLRRVV